MSLLLRAEKLPQGGHIGQVLRTPRGLLHRDQVRDGRHGHGKTAHPNCCRIAHELFLWEGVGREDVDLTQQVGRVVEREHLELALLHPPATDLRVRKA